MSSARFCSVSRVIIFIVLWSELFLLLRYFTVYAALQYAVHRILNFVSAVAFLHWRAASSAEWILVNLRFRFGFLPSPVHAVGHGLFRQVRIEIIILNLWGMQPSLEIARNLMRFTAFWAAWSSMPSPAVDYYRNVLFKTCAGFWTASAHPVWMRQTELIRFSWSLGILSGSCSTTFRSIATTIKNILYSASIVRKLPLLLLLHTAPLARTQESQEGFLLT